MNRLMVLAAIALMAAPAPSLFAQEGLPPGSRSLSKIIQILEQKKIQPVSIVLDQRQWKVEGIGKKESVRLRVDPRSGRIISQETIPELDPIKASLPLSRIVHKLEEARPGPIFRVHYGKKSWIIETRSGKTTTQIELSSDSGELLNGRDG